MTLPSARLLSWYCRLAGSADTATGIFLVTAPALTLRLMGATRPVADLIWVRWVGVFVAAVGLLYWLPEVPGREHRRRARRITALESTTVLRLAVAVFVGWALITGRLEAAFASVLATDLGLGVAQIVMLCILSADDGESA